MLAANVVRSPGCHGFSISRLRTRLDRGNFPQACHTSSQPSHRVQLAIANRNSVMPCEFLQHLGLRATMLPGFWTTFRRSRLRGLPVPGCHPQERSLRGQMHQPECVSVRLYSTRVRMRPCFISRYALASGYVRIPRKNRVLTPADTSVSAA